MSTERPKMAQITLTVQAELSFAPHMSAGYMRFTFQDTTAYVSDEDANGQTVPLGTVAGTIGGGIDVHLDAHEETWSISAPAFWHAVNTARAAAVAQYGEDVAQWPSK